MAQVSDLKSCLMWETERPCVGTPRQSSYFRMFGEEWCLQLSLVDYDSTRYLCYVYLHGRNSGQTLKSSISAKGHVIAGGMELSCSTSYPIQKSGAWSFYITAPKTNFYPSDSSTKWTVYVRLSCAEPLSLQLLFTLSPAMAQVSDLQSCLMWETERPCRTKQSSYFRMFGEEWCLQLSLVDCDSTRYQCYVYLHGRNGGQTLKSSISAKADIIAGGMALSCSTSYPIQKSGAWSFYITAPKTNFTPSDSSTRWTVYVSLSYAKPLSLQLLFTLSPAMAQVSDLQSCLMWETERPCVGRTKQSSYFRMFGEEWCLQLSLMDCDSTRYQCSVYLNRRNGFQTLKSSISSKADIIAGGMALRGSTSQSIQKSGECCFLITAPKTNFTPSDSSTKWTVYVRLTCAEPLSLQLQDETENIERAIHQTARYSDFPANLQNLSLDLANLLKNGTLSDVQLKCGVRDEPIPAHRAVLAARSEVFEAMFRNEMAESRSGDVDVPDVEDDVIDPFLQYVYSGQIPSGVSDEVVPGLYAAADKYAVHGLREACRDRMVWGLTEENCVEFLTVAGAHSDVDLKKSVVDFICRHKAVFKRDAWREFVEKWPLLAIEVYQSNVERET